jgi:hypothetical protein
MSHTLSDEPILALLSYLNQGLVFSSQSLEYLPQYVGQQRLLGLVGMTLADVV